jgi:single-strand DNA-binding protein
MARRTAVDDEATAAADPVDERIRVVARNEVILHGRVAAAPVERELPSGDSVITVRLIVDRGAQPSGRSTQRVDTIDCVAWTARVQRTVRRWQPEDAVEVSGALRRRFYRAADGPRSRFEVEINQARRQR